MVLQLTPAERIGDESGDAAGVFVELGAELRAEQALLGSDANGGAADIEDGGYRDDGPAAEHQAGGESQAEQGRVNGMADIAVRAAGARPVRERRQRRGRLR